METISVALILLLAVVVSGMLARMSPFALPLPLFQITLGVAISFVADLRVELDPDIFFLLFLPPLLFLDGWRIPKQGLFRDKGTIAQLALGLVVFTVVGIGFLVHWMIPSMPLAVAFALAAIVSPTDPIAVSAIAARVPMPRRLMHILEGESLQNDASGLIFMRFAVFDQCSQCEAAKRNHNPAKPTLGPGYEITDDRQAGDDERVDNEITVVTDRA